jgi:hypothetical protein
MRYPEILVESHKSSASLNSNSSLSFYLPFLLRLSSAAATNCIFFLGDVREEEELLLTEMWKPYRNIYI